MPSLHHSSFIPASPTTVFDWHARPGAFQRLTPPWENVTLLDRQAGLVVGAVWRLRAGLGPFQLSWDAHLETVSRPDRFVDVARRGPFARWRHEHHFIPERDGTRLEDRIDYELPFAVVSQPLVGRWVHERMARMFRFRHRRTRDDLARIGSAGLPPGCYLVTGSGGLVGSELVHFLTAAGHQVKRLVRRPVRPGSGEIFWDPSSGELKPDDLEGLDGVIHLAGENIAAGRWSDARKEQLVQSRVLGTELLSRTLARLKNPPSVLISASATGYYANHPEEIWTEQSPPGDGFLGRLCQQWEAATEPARDAGIRTVHLRTGIVLTPRGGALARLLPVFQLGGGGPIGHGRQWMSWIDLEDLIGIIHWALATPHVSGPLNAVSPEPVTNSQFARTLGEVLHRPALLPLPGPVVTAMFGEMGRVLLLEGARVEPQRLQAEAFTFLHPTLRSSLEAMLGDAGT